MCLSGHSVSEQIVSGPMIPYIVNKFGNSGLQCLFHEYTVDINGSDIPAWNNTTPYHTVMIVNLHVFPSQATFTLSTASALKAAVTSVPFTLTSEHLHVQRASE